MTFALVREFSKGFKSFVSKFGKVIKVKSYRNFDTINFKKMYICFVSFSICYSKNSLADTLILKLKQTIWKIETCLWKIKNLDFLVYIFEEMIWISMSTCLVKINSLQAFLPIFGKASIRRSNKIYILSDVNKILIKICTEVLLG